MRAAATATSATLAPAAARNALLQRRRRRRRVFRAGEIGGGGDQTGTRNNATTRCVTRTAGKRDARRALSGARSVPAAGPTKIFASVSAESIRERSAVLGTEGVPEQVPVARAKIVSRV